MGKWIFFVPVLLIIAAVAVYFVLIPKIYGETIPIVDWFIADSTQITKSLNAGNVSLPKIRGIVVLEIFWWIWSILFVTSLFFVGKRLQNPDEAFSEYAVMVGDDPYLTVHDALIMLNRHSSSEELNEVSRSLKKLSERLQQESDFGRGNPDVINCENEIAELLKQLVLLAKNFQVDNSGENIRTAVTLIERINSLLSVRADLEKKR